MLQIKYLWSCYGCGYIIIYHTPFNRHYVIVLPEVFVCLCILAIAPVSMLLSHRGQLQISMAYQSTCNTTFPLNPKRVIIVLCSQ